jgi:hypothetical protein
MNSCADYEIDDPLTKSIQQTLRVADEKSGRERFWINCRALFDEGT